MSAVALHRPRVVTSVPRTRAATSSTATVSAPSGRRTLVLAIATVLMIAAGVFGAVALNAMAADAAVQARALEREVVAAERRYAELIVAVAVKQDPARIRAEALELGLVPSSAARHLILERPIAADGAWGASQEDTLAPDPLKPVLTLER
jgi:ferredoxin-NADP reductase